MGLLCTAASATCPNPSMVCTALARSGGSSLSGSLFVFVNHTRGTVKLLYWDRDGLALWHKRLVKGHFTLPGKGSADALIERRNLSMLLEGIVPGKGEERYKKEVIRSPSARPIFGVNHPLEPAGLSVSFLTAGEKRCP